jgi:membrane protease subunits, stomatin/prohibitin homologs
MFLFVLGALAVIVGIIFILYVLIKCKNGTYPSQKKVGNAVGALALLVGVALISMSCMTSIPTGHTGIVTTFGRVENDTYEAGIHTKAPWQKVIKMDNRIQKSVVELSCFSSDIQEVAAVYTINYQIEKANAQTIYRTIGQDYYSTVIMPRIQESVKSVIAKYNAESLISSREKLSVEIKSILVEKLAAYNIEVIDASIENLDFSDTYTDAVEAKQVAEQNKLKAQIEQEQAILEAEAAAKRAVIEAEAEAEVKKIDADAKAYAGEKEAEANGKIADSLSSELIEYKYVEKWDGKLPTYVGGEGGTIPILNIGAGAGADTDE